VEGIGDNWGWRAGKGVAAAAVCDAGLMRMSRARRCTASNIKRCCYSRACHVSSCLADGESTQAAGAAAAEQAAVVVVVARCCCQTCSAACSSFLQGEAELGKGAADGLGVQRAGASRLGLTLIMAIDPHVPALKLPTAHRFCVYCTAVQLDAVNRRAWPEISCAVLLVTAHRRGQRKQERRPHG
jgi:hypothetical protein